MKTVEKKILCAYFQDVKDGIKKFEIRKDEDDIQPEDEVILKEFNGLEYTGREVKVKVDYVLRYAQGLQEGFCIWSITLMKEEEKKDGGEAVVLRGEEEKESDIHSA